MFSRLHEELKSAWLSGNTARLDTLIEHANRAEMPKSLVEIALSEARRVDKGEGSAPLPVGHVAARTGGLGSALLVELRSRDIKDAEETVRKILGRHNAHPVPMKDVGHDLLECATVRLFAPTTYSKLSEELIAKAKPLEVEVFHGWDAGHQHHLMHDHSTGAVGTGCEVDSLKHLQWNEDQFSVRCERHHFGAVRDIVVGMEGVTVMSDDSGKEWKANPDTLVDVGEYRDGIVELIKELEAYVYVRAVYHNMDKASIE